MSERISDERLTKIRAWFYEHAIQGPWEDHFNELLNGFKAEREEVTRLRRALDGVLDELLRQANVTRSTGAEEAIRSEILQRCTAIAEARGDGDG